MKKFLSIGFVLALLLIFTVYSVYSKKSEINSNLEDSAIVEFAELPIKQKNQVRRDYVRIADLNAISIALTIYYNDHNEYPAASGCLDPAATSGTAFELISGEYIDRNDFPLDPDPANVIAGCRGQYYYEVLTYQGLANNAFSVWTNPEADTAGNASPDCLGKTTLEELESIDACIFNGVVATTGDANIFGIQY